MVDINDADYFLSVLHILSGGPIHNSMQLWIKAYSAGVLYIWLVFGPPVILIGSINYLGKILKHHVKSYSRQVITWESLVIR